MLSRLAAASAIALSGTSTRATRERTKEEHMKNARILYWIVTGKLLGVGAVLVPGFRRLKEWAYAGLVFDLSGALYSHVSIGDPPSVWVFPIIGLLLVGGSYLLGIFLTPSQSASMTRQALCAGPAVANVRRK